MESYFCLQKLISPILSFDIHIAKHEFNNTNVNVRIKMKKENVWIQEPYL